MVLLYHPCALNALVEELKFVTRNCLRKHVMTPYDKLSVKRVSGNKFLLPEIIFSDDGSFVTLLAPCSRRLGMQARNGQSGQERSDPVFERPR